MKYLVHGLIPVDHGNHLVSSGKLGAIFKRIEEEFKPEVWINLPESKERAFYLVVTLEKPADIPRLTEALFNALHAKIEVTPCFLNSDIPADGSLFKWAASWHDLAHK